MESILQKTTGSLLILSLLFVASCKKKENDEEPSPKYNGIRTGIDYNTLTPTTPYKQLFLDNNGDSVVDLTNGNTRYRMYQALNYYLGAAARDSKALDSVVMNNMFSNTGSPFADVASLNISGGKLNSATIALRDITASSATADGETGRKKIERLFGDMARLSVYFADTAKIGKPGKAETYLADARGIEVAQVIQKSLIGATQLDYISNVLLNSGLDADNKNIVPGKKYTQLEQNWDEAYGFLTLNPVYLLNSTDAVRGTAESFLGSYLWEYNKADYPKIFPAFLKGRAAVANNDLPEVKAQAALIRAAMEKAIASAAVGYLGKWKTGATDAARIHAMGEGIGFIYSLRYCKLNGGDAIFSDGILNNLMNSPNGYWDLTAMKINDAINAITTRFKL